MSTSVTRNRRSAVTPLEGPVLRGLLRFCIPIILSGILQILYNTADLVVVGQFCGKTSLAAIGATGSLINLFQQLFIGLAVGVNVLTARMIGAGNDKSASRTVHTAVPLALICGLFLAVIGSVFAPQALRLMSTPENVLPLSSAYVIIYFLGAPANLLYNFGAAVLRASGDSRRPLLFLVISGATNLVLNLFFVLVLRMNVAGVALATILSQMLSAALVLRTLLRADGCIRFRFRNMRIHRYELIEMVKIGVPSGLQSIMFSISNVAIQSSFNSFGDTVMAGSSASSQIEGYTYSIMNSVYQATLTFVSQNFGAGNFKRLKKIIPACFGTLILFGGVTGTLEILFRYPLLSIFTSDPEVIDQGVVRLVVINSTYVLCGLSEVCSGILRAFGKQLFPTFVTMFGVTGSRLIWIATVFRRNRTLFVLCLCYPMSWILTTAVLAPASFIVFVNARKKFARSPADDPDPHLTA